MRPTCIPDKLKNLHKSEGEIIAREVGKELEHIVLGVIQKTRGHGTAIWLSGDWYKICDIYTGEVVVIFKYEHDALKFVQESYYGTSYKIQKVGVSV